MSANNMIIVMKKRKKIILKEKDYKILFLLRLVKIKRKHGGQKVTLNCCYFKIYKLEISILDIGETFKSLYLTIAVTVIAVREFFKQKLLNR